MQRTGSALGAVAVVVALVRSPDGGYVPAIAVLLALSALALWPARGMRP
ncbi:hypothetical protein [Luteimonas sp. R10]|nr:hypothetical protein U3649_17195 [Luteimonas sp. R10]